MSSASDVQLESVVKSFDGVAAVDGISLEIPAGSFFALLGPSGCGKTTTLRMIGGFEEPDAGSILLGGKDVVGLPPHKRDVNTVFQSYALFPHLSIHENVAFGLRRKGIKGSELQGRVAEILRRVGPRGVRVAQATPALRRTAAAGRARAGARQRPAGAPPRRAARRSRPEAAQAAPARAESTPARSGDHVRPRHARSGGGDDDGRHDRGDEPRPGRAAGRAGRALRPAAHGVRRRLPRRLEPAPRHRHRSRSRPDRNGRRAERPARAAAPATSPSAFGRRSFASARRWKARTRSRARSRRPRTWASQPSTSSRPAPATSSSTPRTATAAGRFRSDPLRCSAGAPNRRSSSTLSKRRLRHEPFSDPQAVARARIARRRRPDPARLPRRLRRRRGRNGRRDHRGREREARRPPPVLELAALHRRRREDEEAADARAVHEADGRRGGLLRGHQRQRLVLRQDPAPALARASRSTATSSSSRTTRVSPGS